MYPPKGSLIVLHHTIGTVFCNRMRVQIFCHRVSSLNLFRVETKRSLHIKKNFTVWAKVR